MRVLLCFADNGLGGTGRSALAMGEAWMRQGHEVDMVALTGLHPAREAEATRLFSIVRPDSIAWHRYDLAHIHHGIIERTDAKELYQRLVESQVLSRASLPLITHNIFAEPERVFDDWNGSVTVGVLGPWAAKQYMARSRDSQRHVRVVPNPQSFDFFRAPTEAERVESRSRLGFGTREHIILRTGSPINNKWHTFYSELASELDDEQRLILLGAPLELRRQLLHNPRVTLVDPVADDEELRRYYWASDVFAHAALQGESFGNVLLESRGCSLPVIYLNRPTRDNTPHGFEFAHGFHVASGRREWIEASKRRAARFEISPEAREVFSLDGVGSQLMRVANRQDDTGWWEVKSLTPTSLLAMHLANNPLVLGVKRLKRGLARKRLMPRRRRSQGQHGS